jgi:hypothetical protein
MSIQRSIVITWRDFIPRLGILRDNSPLRVGVRAAPYSAA